MKQHSFIGLSGIILILIQGIAIAQTLPSALTDLLNPPASGPALSVDTTADRHVISPDIYGLNWADPAIATELALPVERWGGNGVEKYNWQLGSSNTGADYYYENIADCFSFDSGCSSGNVPYYRAFISRALARGSKPLVELPLMGYVAKNAPTDHPFTCSFPKTQFPNQQSFDPYDTNCGNGVSSNGTPLTANPTTAGVAIDAANARDWINDLKARYGSASAGGVRLYELGNEPALWNSTHPDMHPSATTYNELYSKSRDTALAVKQADSSAKVLAFSEWGWPNYFCSAADNLSQGCSASSPDRAAHGGTALVEWLLRQFRSYEQTNGQRLMDYIDVHYYRQGGSTADVTRSLWDTNYNDPSWINDKIRLIPRMHEWVTNNYPGTKIALSEYNLSISGQDTLNAIMQADVLGIFAREGLDLATRWSIGDDGTGSALTHIYDAFRLYRNYDGAGSRFGDTYVRSTSADQTQIAIYSALRGSDGKLTIVVINKTNKTLSSKLTLNGSSPTANAQVWRWSGNGIQKQADQALNGGAISYPAMSMTLYVMAVR